MPQHKTFGEEGVKENFSSAVTLPVVPRIVPHLVLVRHGESEGNVINRELQSGAISEFPEEYRKIPDRELRLTSVGREQAHVTGKWLREQYPEGFDVIYSSHFDRARRTAEILRESAGWLATPLVVQPILAERNWGRVVHATAQGLQEMLQEIRKDPLHFRPPEGETMHEARARAGTFLRELNQRFGQRALVVSHGEYIQSLWAEVAQFDDASFADLYRSEDGHIKNCQVVEFSPVHSETLRDDRMLWVRSSCPRAGIVRAWAMRERC